MSSEVASLEGSHARVTVALSFETSWDDVRVTINDHTNGEETPYTAALKSSIEALLRDRFGVPHPEFKRVVDWPLGA